MLVKLRDTNIKLKKKKTKKAIRKIQLQEVKIILNFLK